MVENIIFWVIVIFSILGQVIYLEYIEAKIPPIEKNKEKANPNIFQYIIGFAAVLIFLLFEAGVIEINVLKRSDLLLTIVGVIVIAAVIVASARDINSRERKH